MSDRDAEYLRKTALGYECLWCKSFARTSESVPFPHHDICPSKQLAAKDAQIVELTDVASSTRKG